MRKTLVAVSVVVFVLCAESIAVAGTNAITKPATRYWAKQWISWAFGSDASPITSGICGELVDDVFLLTAAFAPGRDEIECEVPRRTPLIVSPAGTIRWAPTDGETPRELRDAVAADIAATTGVRLVVDGRVADVSDAFIDTRVFTLPLEVGNFIQAVDPNVMGDEVLVAFAGWFLRVGRLSPGEHSLVVATRIAGELFKLRFHLTVV